MARRKQTAEEMGAKQKAISISEFFAKNRHLLGFDNPTKAVLTTVKEAVDNSLDACEEAGILPDLIITVKPVSGAIQRAEIAPRGKKTADKRAKNGGPSNYIITIEDNGPGIVKKQVTRIFGKLLYGSKFHRLRQSRGQQGIGISAAGMYGQMTTHKPMRISTRTSSRRPTYYCELKLDTKTNEPIIIREMEINKGEGGNPDDPNNPEIQNPHGTRVSIELLGDYRKGRTGVDEYIRQTAIANPHARIVFHSPSGTVEYPRAVEELPPEPKEIKPHPYGIELGQLGNMLAQTSCGTLAAFLHEEFSKVSKSLAGQIVVEANRLLPGKDITPRSRPSNIAKSNAKLRALYKAIQTIPIQRPNVNVLAPIGADAILAGLKKEIRAEFYASTSRKPSVYRGNPFLVEVGLAYGGDLSKPDERIVDTLNSEDDEEETRNAGEDRAGPARLLRFANRVPLQYKQSDCAITKAIQQTNWRTYGLSQKRGQFPVGPMEIMVHIASVWVPFTSESKEAVADYDAIRKEIKLALTECARKLGTFIRKRKQAAREMERRRIFELYIEEVVQAVKRIKGEEFDESRLRDNLAEIARKKTRPDLLDVEDNPEGGPDGDPSGASVDPESGLDAETVSDGAATKSAEQPSDPADASDDGEYRTLFDAIEENVTKKDPPDDSPKKKKRSRRQGRAAG